MDEKTETALRASIKHWEENVAAEKPSEASALGSSCALCIKFNNRDGCEGCPVAEAGHPACAGSPWEDAYETLALWRAAVANEKEGHIGLGAAIAAMVPASTEAPENWRKAAQAELDFLRSLLPGESGETK